MNTVSFIAVLLLVTLASGNLRIDLQETLDSLYLEERHVYLGEFPACIAPEISGVRRLLRFGSKIDNTANVTALRDEPPSIHYSIDGLSGDIQLTCLRDSRCTVGTPARFTCSSAGVSPNCSNIMPSVATCHWIDISTLNSTTFTVNLTLEDESYTFPVNTETLSGPPDEAVRIATAMTLLVFCNLVIIFLPYVMYRETEPEIKNKSL
jgi:hypothetical protein